MEIPIQEVSAPGPEISAGSARRFSGVQRGKSRFNLCAGDFSLGGKPASFAQAKNAKKFTSFFLQTY
jgi:hypothetical protein